MTDEQFSNLVAQLEESAKRDPEGYRRRVVALALLGYAYLGLILVVLAILFLVALASLAVLKAVAFKFIIPIGAFIVLVLRAMWVRLTPPGGREITRAEAPALFDAIEDLRRKLRAPRFHSVLITDTFNAGIVQVPRLGMLGWHRNYLLIGLPLLKSLTVEQFRSVLAHEFGHLSAGHARISNWIYRLRMSWARLMGVLEHQRSWGTFMFRRFFNWYVPYFSAYSFPLARANEYEADSVATTLASPRAMAEALTSTSVVQSYLSERYWPELHQRADDTPQPAFAPFARMGEQLAAGLEEQSTRSWMDRALALKTDAANTHPSLTDRLRAIGETPRLALPAAGQSADALLGEALPTVTADLDRHWQLSIRPAWEQRHKEVRDGRARLAELELLAAKGELDFPAAMERARLTEAFGAGADAAFEQFRAMHARAPDAPLHGFALGVRLLARNDESGFKLVEQAMAREESLILAGSEQLRDYCWRKGRVDEARAWHARWAARAQLVQAVKAERGQVYSNDKFDRHGLPDDVVAGLRKQLAAIPNLKKAYLVCKRVQHLSHLPLYILGFSASSWWQFRGKRRATETQQAILARVRFPGDFLVLSVEGENYRFGRKFRWMSGSRIL